MISTASAREQGACSASPRFRRIMDPAGILTGILGILLLTANCINLVLFPPIIVGDHCDLSGTGSIVGVVLVLVGATILLMNVALRWTEKRSKGKAPDESPP